MISKKMKKLVLGSSLLFATGLAGLSASCGEDTKEPENPNIRQPENPGGVTNNPGTTVSKRYDVPLTPDITIGVTWSTGRAQWNAFEKIINVYNEKMKNAPGFKPVNLVNLGSGYSEGAKKITDQFATNTMPYNATFNYAAVAAKLAQNDMLLDFNDPSEPNRIPLETFSDRFLSSNTTTEFINNNNGQGLYMLPYAKSSTVFSINAPVLYYIIKNMLDNGATLKEGDVKMANFYEELKTKGAADFEGVKSIWGAPKDNASEIVDNMIISYDIFETYLDLINFSEKAQKMFINSGAPDAVSKDVRVFGIDDPAGFFETNIFQDVNANYKDSLFATVSNDGRNTVNYNAIITDGSPTQNKAKTIFEKYLEAMKIGALFLHEGGSYASQNQIYHKYAFSIGSSAGYSHNYVKSNEVRNSFVGESSSGLIEQNLYTTSNRENVLTFNAVPSNATATEQTEFLTKLFPPSNDGTKNRNLKESFETDFSKLIAFIGQFKNPIFASTYTNELESYQNKLLPGYDEIAKTAFSSEGVDSNSKLLLFSSPISTRRVPESFLNIIKTRLENSSNGVFAGEMKDNQNKHGLLVISKDGSTEGIVSLMNELGYTHIPPSSSRQLSKDELIALQPPTKWSSNNAKKVVFSQGPSLIGIHTNADGDAATRLFAHWLVTNTDLFEFEEGQDPEQITPYFEKKASYIVAKDLENLDVSIFSNPYLQVAADSFKIASIDPETVVYETPGSTLGDTYREKLTSSLSNIQKSFTNDGQNPTFTDFINDLKQETEIFN